jgi:hypothetical protein
MRVLDMGAFAKGEVYEIPTSIRDNAEALQEFKEMMSKIEYTYNRLHKKYKIPAEDARMVIPLAAQHDITWTLNLKALAHVLKKRGCWILQLGFWRPVIGGIVNELVQKVDPLFSALIQPPCVSKGCYKGCVFKLDNEQRFEGKDPLPPCAIFLEKEAPLLKQQLLDGRTTEWIELYFAMKEKYEALWGFSIEALK